MLKLIVIFILYFVQLINCDQTNSIDQVVSANYSRSESNKSKEVFEFEAIQLFEKLKKLETTTLENIKKLNFLSNDQMIAKSKIYEGYDLEFNKELATLQNVVQPKLFKGLDLENCSSKTAEEFDAIYADEKTYPNILLMELQVEQDKIVMNYSRKIENSFKNGIEQFKMNFLNSDSLNNTELANFSKSFEHFLVEINHKMEVDYKTAGEDIVTTTTLYRTSLNENLLKIKNRMNVLVEHFVDCTKDLEFDIN